MKTKEPSTFVAGAVKRKLPPVIAKELPNKKVLARVADRKRGKTDNPEFAKPKELKGLVIPRDLQLIGPEARKIQFVLHDDSKCVSLLLSAHGLTVLGWAPSFQVKTAS